MKFSTNKKNTQQIISVNNNSTTENWYLKVLVIVLFSICFFIYNNASAQVTVRLNTESQTLWGPVGYNYVNYYYLPEADVFYSVPQNKFFYPEGKTWVSASTLPAKYNVDLFNTYKVVVNKPKPYLNHGYYVSNYAKYKKGAPKQMIIRESDDSRYYIIKNHPKHNLHKIKDHDKKEEDHEEKHQNKNKHHGKKNNK
jgi:hypothetical protein